MHCETAQLATDRHWSTYQTTRRSLRRFPFNLNQSSINILFRTSDLRRSVTNCRACDPSSKGYQSQGHHLLSTIRWKPPAACLDLLPCSDKPGQTGLPLKHSPLVHGDAPGRPFAPGRVISDGTQEHDGQRMHCQHPSF